MTLASIVIPSRGGAKRLPVLLSALAAQDDRDWEAIVVIDGDIDDSASVVARYAHLPVRSIVFPDNRGRVAALNAGFAEAGGDVLIRCDDDLVPAPDYVRQHKAAATAHGSAIGLCLNELPDTPYARAYGAEADKLFQAAAYRTPSDSAWRYWGGNVSVTREIWQRVGLYDTDYRSYGWEDVDYGYRVFADGNPVTIVRELATPHRLAAVTTRLRVLRAFHSGAARRTFEGKHPEARLSPAEPSPSSMWNKLVLAIGKHSTRRGLALAARVVDVLARVLPRPISRKLIALLVEGAGVAGYRRPSDTTTDF
ncbi:glycosyltransferase family 2 protein [uncultured Tessaracoccus sp.]|uniref:glycosyltransferase family 2 protein n=1 Tax=uncultured Tessaracoccus sp. TaxID=905023 RepID=UPI002639E430|nr:glycosyltransferase family A protein [uncultured Tessaracoccus sp.]